MKRLTTFFSLILTLSALNACSLFSSVSVETAHTFAEPPSDIKIYLSVEQLGEPVDYLDESNFSIYENDVLLDSQEIGLSLLPRDSLAEGQTVLLLDLSQTPDEETLRRLERGASHFVEKVTSTQDVTILAYDGSPKVRTIAHYPRVTAEVERALPPLKNFTGGDPSRDLHGAVLEALSVLKQKLENSSKPVQLGTLVVHVQGPDLAGRKTEEELREALRASTYEHYAIGPQDVDIPPFSRLGKDMSLRYDTLDALPLRFQDLGMRVRKAWRRNYLLSYCSPARAGTRQVTTQVRYLDIEGAERSGRGHTEFSADGFSAGCKRTSPKRAMLDHDVPTQPIEPPPPAEPSAAPGGGSTHSPKKPAGTQPKPKPTSTPTAPASPPSSEDDIVAPPSSGKYK